MKKALEIGGFVAGGVLIIFGVIAPSSSASWAATPSNKNLKNEFITGTPDMTPSGIAAGGHKRSRPSSRRSRLPKRKRRIQTPSRRP